MKKLQYIILFIILVCANSCSNFDDSSLHDRVDSYKERIKALKLKAEEMNRQLTDLSYLTNGNVITSVSKDSEGKYLVTYKDNQDKEHTVIIATMSDIIEVPILGVGLEDGVYYWTQYVNGKTSWLTDDNDQKFPVSGYTPTISVDINGYWTVDGQQIMDEQGKPIAAKNDATSVFRDAHLDDNGNFCLTLGDGAKVTLPIFNSLNIKLDATPITVIADISKAITINYTLTGASMDKSLVALAKVEGVNAVLNRDKKTITVSFDTAFSAGKVFVMAYDLAQNVVLRPLFFQQSGGTIILSTVDELKAFAAGVNAGGEQATAKVVLAADIDLGEGSAWTPIGNGNYTTANIISGAAFKGSFDGQGHTLKNLHITIPADAPSGSAWGLFGILQGATVRNVIIDSGSSITSTATAMTAVGAVAGYAFESVVEKCENHASIDIQGGANNVRETAGGILGWIATGDAETYIRQCVNHGKITAINTLNTSNGGNGFSIAGIAGFSDATGTAYNYLIECTNLGTIKVQATRTAGIVASMNKYTKAEKCVNQAAITSTDVKASNSRVAGIVAGMGKETHLAGCVNHGTISFAVAGNTTQGYAGGIAGQTNDKSSIIDECENYGTVLSDIIQGEPSKQFIGLIVANTNNKTITIRNCKVGGKIGAYANGEAGATAITADNFANYICFSASTPPTLTNNSFAGTPVKTGISTVTDLEAFRDAVNAGQSIVPWQDQSGVVNLLQDLDMTNVTAWVPIGNATFDWVSNKLTLHGNAFSVKFDGNGHVIKNLKLTYTGSTAGAAHGLFGALNGATVSNLTLDKGCSLSVVSSGSGITATGVIAGLCNESIIEGCTSYASMSYSGTSTKQVTMALVGFVFCNNNPTKITHLKNYGTITANGSGNLETGGNAIHCAGICGFATNDVTSTKCNVVAYCDNYGNIDTNVARAAGIIGSMNRYTSLNSCTNHGDQINSMPKTDGARLGNITCFVNTGSSLTDCINNGNLISKTEGRVGGIANLVSDASATISGCANYGDVISDSAYRGLFFGYSSKASTWINCIAGGRVGVYAEGATVFDSYSPSDQLRYLGPQKANTQIVAENITYQIGSSSGGSGGGSAITPTLRILFIGNSFTKDAVEHLPKMLAASGIQSVKMVHMYYGGRTIPEYTTGYATVSDYSCYQCNTGSSVWVAYKGYTLQSIADSDQWDVVVLQEHTGKACAWEWNSTEKNAISELLTNIKMGQPKEHTPKFAYIMSQAYFNMDKLSAGQSGRFSSQNEMFQTIVAQAQKVLAETDVEQIIPTGTVLQNLRSSTLDNALNLTRDGYHMDYGISRYAAACAVFESLISPHFENITLDKNSFRYNISNTTAGSYSTPVTDTNAPIALQAARAALKTPFAVTEMSGQ